MTTDHYK